MLLVFVRPLSLILLFIHHHPSHSIANVFNDCPDQVLRTCVEWFSEWICFWIDCYFYSKRLDWTQFASSWDMQESSSSLLSLPNFTFHLCLIWWIKQNYLTVLITTASTHNLIHFLAIQVLCKYLWSTFIHFSLVLNELLPNPNITNLFAFIFIQYHFIVLIFFF